MSRASNYDDFNDIVKSLGHLKNLYNDVVINSNGIYFIMKSANEDDIHKAIKYQVWTSSIKNNQVLSAAYKEAQ